MKKLSMEEALAQFQTLLQAEIARRGLVHASTDATDKASAFEYTDITRFSIAELLLRATCQDAARCSDRRCRRSRTCRHLANLEAQRGGSHGRTPSCRPPGAEALRHAMWMYMNACMTRAAAEAPPLASSHNDEDRDSPHP